jgi:hypothetical protein
MDARPAGGTTPARVRTSGPSQTRDGAGAAGRRRVPEMARSGTEVVSMRVRCHLSRQRILRILRMSPSRHSPLCQRWHDAAPAGRLRGTTREAAAERAGAIRDRHAD